MTMTASQLFKVTSILETARQDGVKNLKAKGITIPDSSSIPAIIGNINNITGQTIINTTELKATGDRIITAADLPNTTFTLYKDDSLLQTLTNADEAYVVAFSVTDDGEYIIKATRDSEEKWQNSINVQGVGQYKCTMKYYNEVTKSAIGNYIPTYKSLKYTWEELQEISEAGFGEYVFEFDGFEYMQTNFMAKGATSEYSRAYLVHIDEENNLIFCYYNFNSTYKMFNTSGTNSNGISWMGCIPRTNSLPAGATQYIYDWTVTDSTNGTYYKYEIEASTFVPVLLPDEYNNETKYYKKTEIAEDGVFLASLKEQLGTVSPRLKNIKTWQGCGAGVTVSTDDLILTTQDYMWLPSDSNIFGDTKRFDDYSKFWLEGETFKAFKNYNEILFRFSSSARWLRSPSVSSSSYSFCYWSNNGYSSSTNMTTSFFVPLCFSI